MDPLVERIRKELGEPDNDRIRKMVERIPLAARTVNCVTAMLCLAGGGYESTLRYAPITGLAKNNSDLLFFIDGNITDYIACEPVSDRSKLDGQRGYFSKSISFQYFEVSFGDKVIQKPWDLNSKMIYGADVVTDIFNARSAEDVWRKVNDGFYEKGLISTVTLDLTADISGNAHHCTTVLKNKGKIGVISKDHYSCLRYQEANSSTIKAIISYNMEGLHLLATDNGNLS